MQVQQQQTDQQGNDQHRADEPEDGTDDEVEQHHNDHCDEDPADDRPKQRAGATWLTRHTASMPVGTPGCVRLSSAQQYRKVTILVSIPGALPDLEASANET